MANKNINPAIILIRPQLDKNIGSVARVMLNFGFTDLRLVSPREIWSDTISIPTAAGADEILNKITIFNNIEDSIHDINFLYATTIRDRSIKKEVLSSKELQNQNFTNCKTAIMFGPENNGLSNEEILLADKIIYINTNKKFSSLNLSQAVGIIIYEISNLETTKKYISDKYLADKSNIKEFLISLENKLEGKNFFQKSFKGNKLMKIINIFNKINFLTKAELDLLNNIIEVLDRK